MRRVRSSPINQTVISISELSQNIPGTLKIETRITNSVKSTGLAHSMNNTNEGMTHRIPLISDVPFYPDPIDRPHPNQ